LKNILKILHQFFLGLGKKNIVNTRFVPSSNQYESYFDEIISRDKILSKIKLNKNSIVLGSCFSIRLANFLHSNFETTILEENIYKLKVNWGRVYNIKNIEQIIEYSIYKKKFLTEKNKNYFFDPLREDTISFCKNQKQILKSISNHRKQSFKAFKNASSIILILGINEVWYDKKTKSYWGTKPVSSILNKNTNRFLIKKLSDKQIYLSLNRSIQLLKKINPSIKIILSLGIVPPEVTFIGKSVLENFFVDQGQIRKIVNKVISKNFKNVTYSPLFEYLFFKNPIVLKADNRHVNDYYVKKALNLIFKK